MHDLAVTYHFQSPWENHHLAASLRLLLKPEHAFLVVSIHFGLLEQLAKLHAL